jgi:septin family protein
VEQCQALLKENGVNLTLTVVDTPGFGDAVDNSNWCVCIIICCFPSTGGQLSNEVEVFAP